MMWRCPVCGQEMSDEQYICTVCGFDERRNFEKYPSLVPLDETMLKDIEQMWQCFVKNKAQKEKADGLKSALKHNLKPENSFWSQASFAAQADISETAPLEDTKKSELKFNSGMLKPTKIFETEKAEEKALDKDEKSEASGEKIKWSKNLKHHGF